jgi:hypothetical protein
MVSSGCFFVVPMLSVLGCAAMACAADDPKQLIAFEFRAYRGLVKTVDDDQLRAWRPSLLSPESTRSEVDAEWSTAWDGICWGMDRDHVAAAWATLGLAGSDPKWRGFGIDPRPQFPETTRLIGRVDGFAWDGHCSASVQVVPLHKRMLRGFWTSQKLIDRLFALSMTPETAFGQLDGCADFAKPVVTESELADGGRSVMRLARSIGGNRVWALRTFYSDRNRGKARLPEEWILASKDLERGETVIYHCELRELDAGGRVLPTRPEDLLTTYADLPIIERVTFYDHTALGKWNRGRVRYVKPGTAFDIEDSQVDRGRGPDRWAVAVVGYIVVTGFLFRQAVLFERRLVE